MQMQRLTARVRSRKQMQTQTCMVPVIVDACNEVAPASRHSFEDCVPALEHKHVVLPERATPADVYARVQQVMPNTSAPDKRKHDLSLCQYRFEFRFDCVQSGSGVAFTHQGFHNTKQPHKQLCVRRIKIIETKHVAAQVASQQEVLGCRVVA